MRAWLLPRLLIIMLVAFTAAIILSACAPDHIAQFWRPVSDPNIEMPLAKVQKKLDFDLSQCKCGIYPTNSSRNDIIQFQPDKQRYAETSEAVTPDEDGQCVQQPSLVVTECMRERGWEPTNCSGRMPLPGGGSLCASYTLNNP